MVLYSDFQPVGNATLVCHEWSIGVPRICGGRIIGLMRKEAKEGVGPMAMSPPFAVWCALSMIQKLMVCLVSVP